MEKTGFLKNENVRKAVYLGVLCAVAYFAVYIARNTLGAVAPKTGFTESFLGKSSSVYFVFYAIGQLVNGAIGDKIKARNMISFGLLFAGIANLVFSFLANVSEVGALAAYAVTGFFLAMIYAPMTKVVSENTEPHYAVRCSLGYTFSSLFGSPAAGVIAAMVAFWQSAFYVSSFLLMGMALICFLCFLTFEKKGYVKYNQYEPPKTEGQGGTLGILIRHDIIRFTVVSVLTGIVRTSVVFWLPTYFAAHLGFSDNQAALIFTVATLIISVSAFLAVFVYEWLGRRMLLTAMLMFLGSTLFFLLTYLVGNPMWNVVCITLAVLCANGAANVLWSIYCPSLRDTGRVSSATGFLDFASYMAAAAATALFATAATTIGWGALILVWVAFMGVGVLITLPLGRKGHAEQ